MLVLTAVQGPSTQLLHCLETVTHWLQGTVMSQWGTRHFCFHNSVSVHRFPHFSIFHFPAANENKTHRNCCYRVALGNTATFLHWLYQKYLPNSWLEVCTLNPIRFTQQGLRHPPLAIQMSLGMSLTGCLIILADWELLKIRHCSILKA